MGVVAIDWGSATVEDARLTVALRGAAPKGFKGELEHVVARLSNDARPWGEVSVGKRKLRVEAIESGAEDDVRHFLESAVLQANAAVGAQPDEPAGGPDAEMAAVFRSFAER